MKMGKQAKENVGRGLVFSHLPTRLERNKSLGARGEGGRRGSTNSRMYTNKPSTICFLSQRSNARFLIKKSEFYVIKTAWGNRLCSPKRNT